MDSLDLQNSAFDICFGFSETPWFASQFGAEGWPWEPPVLGRTNPSSSETRIKSGKGIAALQERCLLAGTFERGSDLDYSLTFVANGDTRVQPRVGQPWVMKNPQPVLHPVGVLHEGVFFPS